MSRFFIVRSDEREVVGERGVEQEPAERRLDEHLARAVAAVLAQHDALRRAVVAGALEVLHRELAGRHPHLDLGVERDRLARGRVALFVRGDRLVERREDATGSVPPSTCSVR